MQNCEPAWGHDNGSVYIDFGINEHLKYFSLGEDVGEHNYYYSDYFYHNLLAHRDFTLCNNTFLFQYLNFMSCQTMKVSD